MAIFAHERQLTPSWDLLRPSYELLKKNIWPVVYLSLIPSLILTLGSTLLGQRQTLDFTSSDALPLTLIGIGFLATLLTLPGYYYLLTQAVRGKEVSALEAFRNGLPRLLPMIAASILAAILITIGFILVIIPGLILFRAFYLAPYYVVDQKLGPVEALKRSYSESKPVSAWVWGVIGVNLIFVLLGSFLGIVPLFGSILGELITLVYAFGPALRYAEVTGERQPVTTPAKS